MAVSKRSLWVIVALLENVGHILNFVRPKCQRDETSSVLFFVQISLPGDILVGFRPADVAIADIQ
jgi:hypothetical protein